MTPVFCRKCGKPEPVIEYPSDAPEQAICPDCCPGTEHANGEVGHEWEYQRGERDHGCVHCGILRRYTDYDDTDRG